MRLRTRHLDGARRHGRDRLFVWLLLLAGALALVRWSRTAGREWRLPDAREVLDERFARGEIDADEYATRRRVLEGR